MEQYQSLHNKDAVSFPKLLSKCISLPFFLLTVYASFSYNVSAKENLLMHFFKNKTKIAK